MVQGTPNSVASVRRFLELHGNPSDVQPADGVDPFGSEVWVGGLDAHSAEDWCQVQGALEDGHLLTWAAAGFHVWRGFGLSPLERLCEPLVLASRIAGDIGLGGLIAIPVRFPDTTRSEIGGAVDRLRRWCIMMAKTALRVQRALDDLNARRARTATQTTQILKAFENRSLIVEVTGHKRFRFWKANV